MSAMGTQTLLDAATSRRPGLEGESAQTLQGSGQTRGRAAAEVHEGQET
jgi:hypothetical protein